VKENWLHFSKQDFVICLQWREISWITKIVTRTQRLLHSATATCGLGFPRYRDLMIALTHITFCRTSLGGWSARRRYLYLTTHNTNKRQTDMTPGEIRTLSTSKRAATNPGCRPRYHWDWISPSVCSRKMPEDWTQCAIPEEHSACMFSSHPRLIVQCVDWQY
jgi:hypothetical protein